ncbi:hypothetical protein ACWEQ4_01470 [Rhodococcus sp. NPDC003994]
MPLVFTHSPGEWDGTFSHILAELVRDILSDGAPIGARIDYEIGRDSYSREYIVEDITGSGDPTLVCRHEEGRGPVVPIPLHSVTGLTIL